MSTTITNSDTNTSTGTTIGIARLAGGLAAGLMVAGLLSGGPASAETSDLYQWRTDLTAPATTVGDGDTDGNDFLVWRRSFGSG